MSQPTSTPANWAATIRQIAPVPDSFPHRALNWLAADPQTVTSRTFREVFDTYDTHQFSVGPGPGDAEARWLRLEGPQHDTHTFSDYERPWPPIGSEWNVVGVSRGADPGWGSLEVPAVPLKARAWATFNRSYLRTTGQLMWAVVDDGPRVTLVISRQRPEVWVLAMSEPEVIARYLTATTGCPWIDNPRPTDPGWTPRDEIHVMDPSEAPLEDPLPESHGRWIRGSSPYAHEPARIEPPAVEVLFPAALDGEMLPAATDADQDLEQLTRRVRAPQGDTRRPAWDAIEDALGGPVRDDVKVLLDTYGAGTFGAVDDESDWPVTAELSWLPAKYVSLVDQAALEFFDVQDLVGDRPPSDLKAIVWATIDANHEDELWLWRVDDRHGIARNADDHARRLPGSAAQNLEDALLGRGLFGDVERDTDLTANALTFTPR
jgi:hypothetical protein